MNKSSSSFTFINLLKYSVSKVIDSQFGNYNLI